MCENALAKVLLILGMNHHFPKKTYQFVLLNLIKLKISL